MNFSVFYSNFSSCANKLLIYMASIAILRPHLRYTSNTMERGKVYVKQTQLDSECWNRLALNKYSHHLC